MSSAEFNFRKCKECNILADQFQQNLQVIGYLQCQKIKMNEVRGGAMQSVVVFFAQDVNTRCDPSKLRTAIGSVPAARLWNIMPTVRGEVMSRNEKKRTLCIRFNEGEFLAVTEVSWPEDLHLEEGEFVDVEQNGKLIYPASSQSPNVKPEDLLGKKMQMMSLEEIFAGIVKEREGPVETSLGAKEREIFKSMGLTFNNSRSLESWVDLADDSDIDDDAVEKTREMVLEDTKNSVSLAFSGPTTAGADKTLKKLLFPCGGSSCPHAGAMMFTLNNLMPTLVGDVKKDLCYECFEECKGPGTTKKNFKIGVANLRTAEQYAVTLEDSMKHPPLESLIYQAYRKLMKASQGEEKSFLRKVGDQGYRKLVMDMIRQNDQEPKKDARLIVKQTMTDVVSITLAARKAFGQARLATVSKATEYLRVIFGDESTEVAAGGGYYCQTCWTQPKYDYHWTLARGCGALSGWFCVANGCPYDRSRMAGLLTFENKSDPQASFVMNTQMPTGSMANILSAIKVVNAIRMGEFAMSDEDIRRAGGLGSAIKNMIAADNDRYWRLFGQLRNVATQAKMTYPNLGSPDNYPHFQIIEGPNEVTLSKKDFGGDRGCVVYDVGKLFNREDPAAPSAEAWRGVIQCVLSGWSIAEAAALQVDPLNAWTSCSKKTLEQLRRWTYIRATGCYPPKGDEPGSKASQVDKAWAAEPFIVN